MKRVLLFFAAIIVGAATVIVLWRLLPFHLPAHQTTKPALNTSLPLSIATPPSSSLAGTIVSHTGTINWTSRVGTTSTLLTKSVLWQGEDVETGSDSTLQVVFPGDEYIEMTGNSVINLIQALAANIVVIQKKGSVTYTASGSTPLSVRSFHLLLQLSKGKMTVFTDDENSQVTVKMLSGSGEMAFNNKNNVTQRLTISGLGIYDDEARTFVKR
ncbi:hypothetical protein HGB07_07015 [Candidatus Roizmanbacteria bacterium]|nr:hypothetical protein [Candidatus Roizmanbacteria bacterium]